MRETFSTAVNFALRWETDKFTDKPSDPGGATKYGITLRTLHDLGLDIDKDGDVDVDDIKILSREDAVKIYLSEYWIKTGCDDLPYPLDWCVFDTAVLQGSGTPKIFLALTNEWKSFIIYRVRHMNQVAYNWLKKKRQDRANNIFGWINRAFDLFNTINMNQK